MNTSSKINRLLLFGLLIFFGIINEAQAQQTIRFRLIDPEQGLDIPGVSYRYADVQGISDTDGFIQFQFKSETRLFLRHISYGNWDLSPEEILKANQIGRIERSENIFQLSPVSVISLKMTEEKDKKIVLSDQERLHHDAGAILSLNPAVAGIRKGGSFAFDPVMRGFKYDQLNIVINGMQSANAACPNRMDPPTSQVALNRIKEVEILKGPHALRYGIGLGGTINYIQESPDFSSESGIYGRLSSLYESNGNVSRNEGRIGFQGSNYDVGILGSWAKGSDYKDGTGQFVPSDFTRGTVGMYGDLRISPKDLVQVSINRNFARDVDFPSLNMDLRTDDTWMGSIKHTRNFKGGSLASWTSSAYFTRVDHLMDNLLRDIDPRMVNSSTPAITENWGIRTEGLWKFKSGKLYAGMDHKVEAAEGTRIREMLMGPMAGKTVYDNLWQNSQISKTGVFANYTFPVGQTILTTSGRLDVNQAIANDPAEEFLLLHPEAKNTQLNPGLSIGAQRSLGSSFNVGLWAAAVQRSGGLLERFINYLPVGLDPFELVGNPQIKPETNYEIDFVLGYDIEGFSLEATVFGSYLTDYISSVKTDLKPRLPSSPGVRQYVNIDEAYKTGFELAFKQRISQRVQHSVQLAYTYGKDLGLNAALPEIAPFDLRYRIQGQFVKDKLHAGLTLRQVATQNRVSEVFGEQKTPGFTLIDADVSYPLGNSLLLKTGAQNLLNEAYYEHLSRPIGADKSPMFSPGRNFFLMISYKFP
ncbi:TonB-dependent receptor domain-containing protein [Algoriphagus hitonicola]|uniref:Iron complex outermembrane recepter protein n=1 Tax=Algoriphagus hitonicola TaxID=435880 RepID=A0A1I2VMQ8_9BACT|nr:TonB-dependent receptor [Algoriphagus hitonicola]SFG90363.1 iron complex outermembrane recepter protein [Algoriphagus hitonicola]